MQTRLKNHVGDDKFIYWLNAFVSFVYWLVFHPGLFSTDSFAAYEMAKSGNLNNAFTASWALYVRFFSLFGHAISMLTLINVLILSYAVTRLCISLFESRSAKSVSFLMCLSPGVSGIGITLWHDIPMTSGFLLLLSSLIRLQKTNLVLSAVWKDLALGAILITFRPNGIPTLALVFLSAIALRKLRNFVRPIAASLMIAGATTLITSYIGIGQAPINKYFSQEWMRNDISCFAAKSDVNDFYSNTKIPITLFQKWRSEEACTFLNGFSLNEVERQNSLSYVPVSWLRLIGSEPGFIFETHLKRNAYLNPIPLFGIPITPFLHTNIEFEDKGVEWTFKAVAQVSRTILRAWNYLRPVTGWVGLWLAIIAGLFFITRNHDYQLMLCFAASLVLILFVFAPIPDGRYGLFVLITGQAILLNQILSKHLEARSVYE